MQYIIGMFPCHLSLFQGPTDYPGLEHMEEDEETPKAIPPWVELEYAVSQPHSSTTGNKKESPTYT